MLRDSLDSSLTKVFIAPTLASYTTTFLLPLAHFKLQMDSQESIVQRMRCPSCGSSMRGGNLVSFHGLYRVCPDCHKKYMTDASTKKRGIVLAILALLTIALSAAGFLFGFPWGIVSFLSGTVSIIYLGYVLKNISYIKYGEH